MSKETRETPGRDEGALGGDEGALGGGEGALEISPSHLQQELRLCSSSLCSQGQP